ncbi:MAG: radical SAM protein [Candidatus Undinarchaeales archaeon]|jgi:radical SAM protein with 4Fe4S-binding SPASM domain|nr:radical SAM protein [Candidatus Undinarchaeales archaeon]MDP7492923.1 radical SAM protein [Candidatus Undinarchaeales archaeon]
MLGKIVSKRDALPEYVTLFVTNKCNCRCTHCFLWKELNDTEGELNLDEIELLSKSMGRFAVLSLTGGEPLLKKDLLDVIRTFHRNNRMRYLVIPTNGTVPARELVERVLEDCPGLRIRVFVSIDDIGERHDLIRGHEGVFDKAVKTFKELRSIGNERLELGTITTYSRLNEDRIFTILEWLRENLRPDITNFPLVRGDVSNPTITDIDIAIYERLMEDVFRRTSGNLVESAKEVMTQLTIQTVRENRYITPCYAGSINAVIRANGDVYPCELLDLRMGNLRENDMDFRKLWSSKKAISVRERITSMKCFCTHGCNMLPNVLFNPRYHPRVICVYLRNLFSGSDSDAPVDTDR